LYSGGRVACDSASGEVSMREETVFYVRIFDTTQVCRLIAFFFAADVTIQHFNESRQRSELFS